MPQAVWELDYYNSNREAFENNRAIRSTYRYGKYPCDQVEAASERKIDDSDAFMWIARRLTRSSKRALQTFVNIGAGDGIEDDPLLDYTSDPLGVSFALAVESDRQLCAQHRVNLPHVQLLCGLVSAKNIDWITRHIPNRLRKAAWERADMGRTFEVPSLDVLKVDLDSIDCDVLQAFLAAVPAKLILTEVNDGVPPPIQMSVHDIGIQWVKGSVTVNNSLESSVGYAWGCSLSYQVRMLGEFGYSLVWYSSPNTIYAHSAVLGQLRLQALDEIDCYSKTRLNSVGPAGRTLRRWFYEVPLQVAVREVRATLTAANTGHPLTVKI